MSPRSLFLSSFGAVYVCAFVSYWLQFEGLYGEDGLLPVRLFWTQIRERVGGGDAPWSKFQRFPCLLWFADDDRNVSALVEGLSLVGAGLGALAVAGVHHGSLFVGMFLCYLSLYGLGQTFLSFQWDIFLLETGAAAVLYAPWWSARCDGVSAGHPAQWILRAQWVKFMLCSGAVKVTAACPTWQRLTALEYHFAST